MNSNEPARRELTDPAYVEEKIAQWGPFLPTSMIVIEFLGRGDPFFGGRADDRALATSGRIKDHPRDGETARFATIEEAHAAALVIPNRRPHSILGVVPAWR